MLQTVHIRVNDAATNKPTPVRIRFIGADGIYYAPFGRLTQFGTEPAQDVGGNLLLDGKEFAYIDGACEIRLPVGPIEVEIHKDPEYLPIRETINLVKGKLALRFTIQRWTDLREQGCYAGDTHSYYLTPHAALLEATAEDLAVVNLLARYSPSGAIPNILAFSGREPALQSPGHAVIVNTLNEHETLGRLALLNCHRAVYPLTFGGEGGVDDWNIADWCEQCHRKKGLVVALDYLRESPFGHEIISDALLGHIDAFDAGDFAHFGPWYDLLNTGFRIALTAGSGKESNRQLFGRPRTYVQVDSNDAMSYQNWIEAVRAGRTFVTHGPLLSFKVNGENPGGDINLMGNTVRVHCEAKSLLPFQDLQILHNGEVLHTVTARDAEPFTQAAVNEEFALHASGWLSAKCTGAHAAHTSPVYVNIADRPFQPNQQATARLHDHLKAAKQWVEQNARFETERQRQRMLAIYADAEKTLEKITIRVDN